MQEEEPRKEDKAETLPETSDSGDKTPEENPNSVKNSRDFTRRSIFHLVCSGYLLYLAFKLGRSFVTGIGANGWNGDMIVCLAGAVVFTAVAVVLLIGCIRRFLARQRDDNNE